ncbi:MAG TPA: hypothetical protein VIT22_00035 [Pseudoxanthomonas sp.]
MQLALAALLLCGLASAQAAIGLQKLPASSQLPVPFALWYPTSQSGNGALPGAAIEAGAHPLIVLSHGSGGSEFGHADLAEALAARGYVVAAPRHLGDSYDEPGGRGTDVQLIGRPWHIKQLLDLLLNDARFAPHIAAGRIGMAGFSAGGYTTLAMLGARYDLALHRAHCAAEWDWELCPAWRLSRFRMTRPGWQLPRETRIRAAVAMAPVSVFFDRAGVAEVKAPLLLVQAKDDAHLPNKWHTARLRTVLPQTPELMEIPGAHFVFLAPCGDGMRARLPKLCNDAPGIDRVAIHTSLNRRIGDFFDAQLKAAP